VAKEVTNQLKELTNQIVKTSSLIDISYADLTSEMYENPPPSIKSFAIENLINPERLVFVIPEYNGSFPGVLKLLIDLASVIDYKGLFTNKEVLLIGVADGRSGNIVGINHFSSIIQYMGGCLSSKNLPLPNISKQFNDDLDLNELTKKAIQIQLKNWRKI
jgi:chromate reductase